MTLAKTFEFACELFKWITMGKEQDKVFTADQEKVLFKNFLDRTLAERREILLLDTFTDNSFFVFRNWAIYDKESLDRHTEKIFKNNPKACLNLLNEFTSSFDSPGQESYQSNLTVRNYENLTSTFNIELIKKYILINFKKEELNSSEVKWDNELGPLQSDINVARQFLHWDKKSSIKEVTEGKVKA
ncbi:MAG: hypothetical protein ACR2KZ_00495 [Segetibacter sp.]